MNSDMLKAKQMERDLLRDRRVLDALADMKDKPRIQSQDVGPVRRVQQASMITSDLLSLVSPTLRQAYSDIGISDLNSYLRKKQMLSAAINMPFEVTSGFKRGTNEFHEYVSKEVEIPLRTKDTWDEIAVTQKFALSAASTSFGEDSAAAKFIKDRLEQTERLAKKSAKTGDTVKMNRLQAINLIMHSLAPYNFEASQRDGFTTYIDVGRGKRKKMFFAMTPEVFGFIEGNVSREADR